MQLAPHAEYETSSTQESTLGALAVATDGRKFRYGKAGAVALAAGKLCQGPALVANHQNIAVAAAAAVGAVEVTVTLGATAATANQYAGGLLVVNDADTEGLVYEIDSHPAADASGSLTLTLKSPVREALTTSSEVSLAQNVYNGVLVNPTTPTGAVVGVPISDIAAGEYGFFCVNGVVGCLNDGGWTAGSAVSPSNAVAGAVEDGVIAQGFVGRALQAGTDTEYNLVDLNIA
jgi:hypothetical protein